MTVTEAAERWLKARAALKVAEADKKTAETVLKEWFHKTGKTHWRGRIAYSTAEYRQLDTAAVRAHLGKRVAEFETVRTRETLTAL